MDVRKIPIAKTFPTYEARPRKAEDVDTIADSMSKVGLLNPISVIPCDYAAGGRTDNAGFKVVAGHHRFDAAKKLGWTEIDAYVIACDSQDFKRRRMIEIAENLHRVELSRLERSDLIAQWVELTAGNQPAQVAQATKPQYQKGGVSDAARQLGMDRDEVRRAVKVASLSPAAKDEAVSLGLDDNQSALLTAAKEKTPERQVEALRQRAEPVKPEPKPEPVDYEEEEDVPLEYNLSIILNGTDYEEYHTTLSEEKKERVINMIESFRQEAAR